MRIVATDWRAYRRDSVKNWLNGGFIFKECVRFWEEKGIVKNFGQVCVA